MSMITPRRYFFGGPVIIASVSIVINTFNIDWDYTPTSIGCSYLFVLGICTIAISEILLKTLLLLIHKPKKIKCVKNIGNTSFIINYNLKAQDKNNIDECFSNMYNTFINNMNKNSIAVLISATENEELQKYEDVSLKNFRKKLFNHLYQNGIKQLNNGNNTNNNSNTNLISMCNDRCYDLILLRRTSGVLKKCGQYQDLIVANLGYSQSYTYTNKELYGEKARVPSAFFSANDGYDRIHGKRFDYTMVLDSDTQVPRGAIVNLIRVAMANPGYTIFQPRITFYLVETVFQRLQVLLQKYSNISFYYTSSFIGHAPFFGKGLIHNKKYFEKCIGTPQHLIEYVPVDALSHDTFESMAVPVLYVNNISVQETLPKTYVSWNIRELRWNIGELIVTRHIYPRLLCRNCWVPNTRNKYGLSFGGAYYALASFRIIIMRPILLLFIILNAYINMRYPYAPLIFMVSISIVIPNLLIVSIMKSIKVYESVIIILTSIIQVAPEPIIGTHRLILACYKLLCNNAKWTPSNKIEQRIAKRGIWFYSFFSFGIYSGGGAVVLYFVYKINIALTFFLSSIIFLPFYSSLTGFNYYGKFIKNKKSEKPEKPKKSRVALRRTQTSERSEQHIEPSIQLNIIIK